jgi:hypothetical protein
MLLGQLLNGKPNTTVTYYSPWFPRSGNLAQFTCQVFGSEGLSGGSEAFKISVQTKNLEQSDKDVSTPQGGGAQTMSLTALALTTWEVGANLSSGNTGFLQLVRFKYELISATGSGEPWVHFRLLNPVWLTN